MIAVRVKKMWWSCLSRETISTFVDKLAVNPLKLKMSHIMPQLVSLLLVIIVQCRLVLMVNDNKYKGILLKMFKMTESEDRK